MFVLSSVLLALIGVQSADVMHVEEDWELVLNVPGQQVEAPHFHTVMSPFGHTDSVYAQVTWNYREGSVMLPGGVQLQAWNGENFLTKKNFGGGNKLSTTAETVSWTQLLKTNGASLMYKVKNGQSTTWGSFGGGEWYLSGSFAVPNLSSYDPKVSLQRCWITYGANRVDLLRIKAIRYYDADGNLLSQDTTPRVVHQQ